MLFSAPGRKGAFVRKAFDPDSLATARLTHYWRGLHDSCVVVDQSGTEYSLSSPRLRGLDTRVFPEQSKWAAWPIMAITVVTLTCNVLLDYEIEETGPLELSRCKELIVERISENPSQVVHRDAKATKGMVRKAANMQRLCALFPL